MINIKLNNYLLTLTVRVEPLESQRELPVSTCIILCTHMWQRTQKLIFHSMKLMMLDTGILQIINMNGFYFSIRFLRSGNSEYCHQVSLLSKYYQIDQYHTTHILILIHAGIDPF
ncbi:Hypothetical_protein [Hexamita inflata]|uniref:Hypothetical_protein n=1 Tax=Hexamita inflata TaxID=28002 RepID=A0AA86QTD0_9EUKA|nr:Hypothetical protein HINF_LOCUS14530 [Hexamita inflata]CAI9965686.1 Hypothetical protein HINF_LOCUS53331 [Hexamita inflata]